MPPKIVVGEVHQSGTQHPSGVTLKARKMTKEEDAERRKKIQREGQSVVAVGSGAAVVKQSGGSSIMPTAGRRRSR